ncbi:MAG: hypothetical protein Q9174_000198 [Haloplaca sp. 1 TL-2023]
MSESTSDIPERPKKEQLLDRANEVSTLLSEVQELLIPFIRAADDDGKVKEAGHGLSKAGGGPRTALLEHHKPQKLSQLLHPQFPDAGIGKDGFLGVVQKVLQYSVNTWDQGFMSNLYASTDAPGIASELILSVLNTNLHVYEVSPALTIIEKATGRALASLFGFNGPHAGGISVQGGSSSNITSIVIARNTLYPESKTSGTQAHSFILFTSAHGHYSIRESAQILGFGSEAVWSVATDSSGRMDPSALDSLISKAKGQGKTPLYVNATAGTTVLGSYDPIRPISKVCRDHNLWLHVDASWGGPVIFSPELAGQNRLDGSHLADSIAINPHWMMGVSLTCSFLLGADLRQFHGSNTSSATSLFHGADDHDDDNSGNQPNEMYDLADLTLQNGRKGDALKLYLSWTYHGSEGYRRQIERAFDTAEYLSGLVAKTEHLRLVSENPPPCLQVCFHYARGGEPKEDGRENTKVTKDVVGGLVRRGFMVDYADLGDGKGAFFRVVVNRDTKRETVNGLVDALVELGERAW